MSGDRCNCAPDCPVCARGSAKPEDLKAHNIRCAATGERSYTFATSGQPMRPAEWLVQHYPLPPTNVQ